MSATFRTHGYKTYDYVVMALLSAVSAVAYVLLAQVWTALTAAAGPLGGALLGLFQFGHLIAYAILRKRGVIFITSVVTTAGQFLLGDPSGVYVFGWGVIHGLGAELIFALMRYKSFSFLAFAFAAGVAAVAGQFYSFYVFGWQDAQYLFYISLPILFASSAIESGGIAYLVHRSVEKAGLVSRDTADEESMIIQEGGAGDPTPPQPDADVANPVAPPSKLVGADKPQRRRGSNDDL